MLAMHHQLDPDTQDRPVKQKEDSEALFSVITGALAGPLDHVITRNTPQTHQTATTSCGQVISLFFSVCLYSGSKNPIYFLQRKI